MQSEPIRILIIEDNPTDLFLFEQALRESGIEQLTLVHVERLGDGLRKLQTEPFDLVLLDLGLPDSFGLATFEKLQSDAPLVPTVVLTNLDDETVALKSLQMGAQDFLIKGDIDGRMLSRSIRYSIERNRLLLAEQRARKAAETAEQDLTKALAEKNVLIQEVHHRVKNNLQVISSLLSLQSRYVTDAQISGVFKDSISRVRSMALVHEMLYGTSDITKINLAEYVKRLIETLVSSYGPARHVELRYQVEPCYLDIYTASPLGLILNEIITNSLKHAFADCNKPEIFVESLGVDPLTLKIGDNGPGMNGTTELESPRSFGLRLIQLLVKQIGASLESQTTGGTVYTIHLPVAR